MCAEYILKAKRKLFEEALGQEIRLSDEDSPEDGPEDGPEEWDLHAKLYSKVPVIVMNEKKELKIRDMHFSLKPPGTKYPTFNARLSGFDQFQGQIVRISEKPTWKKPLETKRCLVPMTGFIEPIYVGPHAGHAVEFSGPDEKALFAPGIYEESVDKKTGELYEGFSLIVHTPSDFILKMGHHRQLVLLNSDEALRWIAPGIKSSDAAYQFLLDHRYMPKLEAKVSRALSKNWEKKIPNYEEKLAREKEFMKALKEF